MQYNNYAINLLEEPITTRLDDAQNKALALETLEQEPRELLLNAKCSYETIIRLYYLRHGFEALDCFMVHYLSVLAFMAYGNIQTEMPDTILQTLQSTILLAVVGLHDQSPSHYTGRMTFSAVRGKMRRQERELIDRHTGQRRLIERHPLQTRVQSPPGALISAVFLLIARLLTLQNSSKKLKSAKSMMGKIQNEF